VTAVQEEQVDQIERFVDQVGIAPFRAGGGGQYVEPTRRDHGHAEGQIAWVN